MLLFRTLLIPTLFLLLLPARAAAPVLQVEDAWVPEAPPVAPVLAGYLTLRNPSGRAITITGASCPDFARVEIHEMGMANGMMTMKQLDSLTVPAGGRVMLKPGGFHLMLISPKKAFQAGDTITVTFELDNGQRLVVQLPVKKRGMTGADHQHHH